MQPPVKFEKSEKSCVLLRTKKPEDTRRFQQQTRERKFDGKFDGSADFRKFFMTEETSRVFARSQYRRRTAKEQLQLTIGGSCVRPP